ncbi:MAG: hypothetical protein VX210_08545 [Myxococcota bacterium]|nr:hypothetical protein [Myxococcota bacterium]
MLLKRFSILATLWLAMIGCGEDALFAGETMAGDTGGDDGFSREIVDVEAAAPGDWADCLLVSEGRLTETTTSQTLTPGGDALLEVTLSNLCDVDIVSYPGLRFSSSSQAIRFSESSLYVYGILSNQSLAMATSLELGTEVESGESIEFIASITHLGCDEAAGDESGEQYCEEITESYRFSWRVGDALAAPGL